MSSVSGRFETWKTCILHHPESSSVTVYVPGRLKEEAFTDQPALGSWTSCNGRWQLKLGQKMPQLRRRIYSTPGCLEFRRLVVQYGFLTLGRVSLVSGKGFWPHCQKYEDVIAELAQLPTFLQRNERWLAEAVAQLALKGCGREDRPQIRSRLSMTSCRSAVISVPFQFDFGGDRIFTGFACWCAERGAGTKRSCKVAN